MTYIAILAIISTLVLVHEFGHLLAARVVGIPIDMFSVGFGPALWKKRIGVTEYRFSLVPLGGFVLPAVADEHDYFRIPVYKRIILALGGPLANLAFMLPLMGLYNTLGNGLSLSGMIIEPFRQTAFIVIQMLGSIQTLITRPGSMSGIIGIIHQGGEAVGNDPLRAIRIAAVLSANLAVFNLLPLPVLDGGKILLALIEKIDRRIRALYIPVMTAGLILVIILMLYGTVLDVGRLVGISG